MSNAVKILERTKELLVGGWCQDHNAEDIHGNTRAWSDRHAASFCVVGALYRAGRDVRGGYDMDIEAYNVMSDVIGPSLSSWNDDEARRKDEVIAAVDAAIKMASRGAQTV